MAMTFEERCETVRRTALSRDMTYDQRLATLRRRYGTTGIRLKDFDKD